MSFLVRLHAFRLFLKSIKDMAHKGRIEGPISPEVKKAILNAIKSRFMLTIYYIGDRENKAGWRLIMPFCYGRHLFTGNHVLRAYQVSGPSYGGKDPYWRMFRLDRMFNVAANTTKTFDKPVYLWNPTGDEDMSSVIAIVSFADTFEIGDVVAYRTDHNGKQYTILQLDKSKHKCMLIENVDKRIRPTEIALTKDLVKIDGTYPPLQIKFSVHMKKEATYSPGDAVEYVGDRTNTYTVIQVDPVAAQAMIIANTTDPIRETRTVRFDELVMINYTPNDDEISSVNDYTSASGVDYNNLLRKGAVLDAFSARNIGEVDNLLDKSKKFQGTVYRSMNFTNKEKYDKFLEAVKGGNRLQDMGYMSTSQSEKATEQFRTKIPDFYGNVELKIQSKTGVDISEYSAIPDEQEVLFPRGSTFEVNEIKETTWEGKPLLELLLQQL